MHTVREINDPRDLDALGPSWHELLERTPNATFFNSLEWLQTYWKHFGAGKRLRVLVVQDRDELIGVLPLVVRAARPFEPARALAYPLDDWGNFYGPIGPEPEVVLAAGLEHVRHTPRDWQFLELGWVDSVAGSGPTERAFKRAGFHAMRQLHDDNALIDLAAYGSWEAYLASRSNKFRENMRNQKNRLARRGKVTFVCHRTNPGDGVNADPRWDMYEACVAISRLGWQDRAAKGNTLSKSETDRAFYHDCHEAATRLGYVDMCLLFVDDQPVAFNYSYHCRGLVTALRTAYDPAYAREGAGAVSFARWVADCIARGDHTIDFGPSEFKGYKTRWTNHMRPTYRYTYFPPAVVRAQLIRGKRIIEGQLRAAVRKWRATRNRSVASHGTSHAGVDAPLSK